MRFLLQGSKLPTKGIRANVPLPPTRDTVKAFGQQCSPQCGCILRFEASLDNNGKVLAATYHAKQIICNTVPTENNNQQHHQQLQPAFTMSRNPKPLFTECTCPCMHKLAKQVVAHLPVQRNLRNQVEFTGVRSSLAFSHAVLTRFQLPTRKTRCLNLVEDALNAMIKQCLPPSTAYNYSGLSTANNNNTTAAATAAGRFPDFTSMLNHQHELVLEQAEEEEFVERFGRALRRVRKPRNAMYGQDANPSFTAASSLSPLSALTLLDNSMMTQHHHHHHHHHHPDEEEEQQQQALGDSNRYLYAGTSADLDDYHDDFEPLSSLPTQQQKLLDWEAYVDGLHHREKNEATG
jgi:hypothetical protein